MKHIKQKLLNLFLLTYSNKNDIILTGLPRSGTTLTTKILSDQPETVALNEPIRFNQVETRPDTLKLTKRSFFRFRRSLRRNGVATARTVNGKITDNHYKRTEANGTRKKLITRSNVVFEKELSKDFKLIIKHNSVFTLLQDELMRLFPYYAVIRNPLAVLGSLNSVDTPASRGNIRHLHKLNPGLKDELDKKKTLTDRQLFILDIYFRQYKKLEESQIIRYEDIIESQGDVLSRVIGKRVHTKQELRNNNVSTIYKPVEMLKVGESLLKSEGSYWHFYSREAVENILAEYDKLT
jgi:hypothetical protein